MIRIIYLLFLLTPVSISAMQLQILQSNCSLCSEPLENQETITLSCRHRIHKACYSSTHHCLECAKEHTDTELEFSDEELPLYPSYRPEEPCYTRSCCLFHTKMTIGIILGLSTVAAALWLVVFSYSSKGNPHAH